jgi:hypothetical protein
MRKFLLCLAVFWFYYGEYGDYRVSGVYESKDKPDKVYENVVDAIKTTIESEHGLTVAPTEIVILDLHKL